LSKKRQADTATSHFFRKRSCTTTVLFKKETGQYAELEGTSQEAADPEILGK
jgi:hypothetical protein